MSTRQAALRAYFLEVVKDLCMRGVIRQKSGQALADILRVEFWTVIGEVEKDFTVIFVEMGKGAVSAGERMLKGAVERVIGHVFGKWS